MKTMRIAGMLAAMTLTACATVTMPSNVATRPIGTSQSYIDAVDFSYQPPTPPGFDQLKLCVAQNVTNRAVQLNDAAGSFVGPATGNYYQASNTQTVQGGGIFKDVEPTMATLIATGTTDGGSAALGLTRDILKFDLKASSRDSRVTLVFNNISRAQQSTGSAANEGFKPVGTWSGARPMQTYAALEGIASNIKACLR